MARIKVVHFKPVSSFNVDWLAPIFDQYLEFVPWDSTQTYAPGTLFYVNCLDVLNEWEHPISLNELIDRGFKIMIDNLWEIDPGPMPNTYRVCCAAWFWYNESLWYQHLGYNNYIPNKTYAKLALMPMRKQHRHRQLVARQLQPYLHDFIWSFAAQGRGLPNDPGDVMIDWNLQRYFDPAWYNDTYFSLAVESTVAATDFITEKTFKPMAFQHPFMVYGPPNTLTKLHQWGFETFENLFNESYDQDLDPITRLNTLEKNIQNFQRIPYDALTLEKIQHNHARFFDVEYVKKKVVEEIVNPLLEYANS